MTDSPSAPDTAANSTPPPKKSRIKTVLMVCIVILALGIVSLVVAFGYVLESEGSRQRLNALLTKSAGMPVNIGKLTFSLWTGTRLGLEQVTAGKTDSPVLKVGNLDLRLSLWPLINRRVEVDSIEITGLEVDAVRSADGEWLLGEHNVTLHQLRTQLSQTGPFWLPPHLATMSTANNAPTPETTQELAIDSIFVDKAIIRVQDQLLNQRVEISPLSIQASVHSLNWETSNIDVKADIRHDIAWAMESPVGIGPNNQKTLRLNAPGLKHNFALSYHPETQDITINALETMGPFYTVVANGSMSGSGDALLDTTLTITDEAALQTYAKPFIGALPVNFKGAQVKGTVELDAKTMNHLTEAQKQRPNYHLLPYKANLTITTQQIKHPFAVAKNLTINAFLEDLKVRFGVKNGTLNGGPLKAEGSVNLGHIDMPLDATIGIKGANLAGIPWQQFGAFKAMKGKASLSASLHKFPLSFPKGWENRVNSKVTTELDGGKVEGINGVKQFAAQAKAYEAIPDLAALFKSIPENYTFSIPTKTFTISRGKVDVTGLAVKSPKAQVGFHGIVGLNGAINTTAVVTDLERMVPKTNKFHTVLKGQKILIPLKGQYPNIAVDKKAITAQIMAWVGLGANSLLGNPLDILKGALPGANDKNGDAKKPIKLDDIKDATDKIKDTFKGNIKDATNDALKLFPGFK